VCDVAVLAVDGSGGGSAHRVLTRDGERDIVDCGGERDTAIVDRSLDIVSRCEVVRG
jgi:hypothetical protein